MNETIPEPPYVRKAELAKMLSSTGGHLNFNAELLDLDRDIWDYVIVREFLHFFVPDHGKLWKRLMRTHLGDWEPLAERFAAAPVGR